MKKIVLLLVLALVGVFTYLIFFNKDDKPKDETPKQQPLAVSKHSEAFNNSVNEVLKSYFALSEAFVNWDSAGIKANATGLKDNIAAIKFDEIKKDTIIHQTAVSYVEGLNGDLTTIIEQPDITEKRHALHSFSQNFYDLLRTIKYDGGTIFLQECPMAFGDTEPGLWLSDKAAIRNPYLGLHHPKYKKGMLECGDTKDSLHFTIQ